ncbi:hypothetical protein CCAX7_25120 [Capsulimonas corticalis]|uniref:Uncharacterized protein n=1 Tax=Capsulimonas corticalis TaxID=2219043 RepID=A0A402CVP4_9BACT|nr:hypothetical protein CCAX7_25120 [Capsulimonas corticalis]
MRTGTRGDFRQVKSRNVKSRIWTRLTAALLLAGSMSFAARGHAQNWPGPTWTEFSGTNQAAQPDELFGGVVGWNRPEPVGWDERAPGQVGHKTLDEIGKSILIWKKAGVTPLVALGYTETWAADKSAREWIDAENIKWTIAPNPDGTFTFCKYTLSGKDWALQSTWKNPGTELSKWPSANPTTWTDYVARTVKFLHAPPYNIQYFQIWNEACDNPTTGFWVGNMDDYMRKIHLPAAAIIHAAGAKVVYGGWPSVRTPAQMTSLFDKYHAWGAIDILDCHYYDPTAMAALRTDADQRGFKKLGVWQTEHGFMPDKTYVANFYPRVLSWSLTHQWNTPNKYKLFYFAEWAPDDPKAYGYGNCLRAGSTLNWHGKELKTLSDLFGKDVLSAYSGISSVPALPQTFNADTSMQGFAAGKKIVVAVHLKPSDYDQYSSLTLKFKIPKSQIISAQRVDLTGNSEALTPTGSAATSVSVSTQDASGSDARAWNEGDQKTPRTFYVVLTCRKAVRGG